MCDVKKEGKFKIRKVNETRCRPTDSKISLLVWRGLRRISLFIRLTIRGLTIELLRGLPLSDLPLKDVANKHWIVS